MQLPNVGAVSETTYGAKAVHHGTDELLVQQDHIPEGETSPLRERTQLSNPLDIFLSNPIDMKQQSLSII